jgi:hypothetical protein
MIAETEKQGEQYLIIDHNIVPGQYVTYIVDIWSGNLHDPATEIKRYIGLWRAEDLETEEAGAFDPDFSKARGRTVSYSYGSWRGGSPEPLVWEEVEVRKTADKSAKDHKKEDKQLTTKKEGFNATSHNKIVDQYQAFLDAVDRVAEDDGDEEAWAAIDAWRNRLNAIHEK